MLVGAGCIHLGFMVGVLRRIGVSMAQCVSLGTPTPGLRGRSHEVATGEVATGAAGSGRDRALGEEVVVVVVDKCSQQSISWVNRAFLTRAIFGSALSMAIASPASAQETEVSTGAVEPASPAPTYRPPPPPNGPPRAPHEALVPAQSTADVRFEPDDPNLRLMTLSGVMPYQEVAYVRRGWWRPRRYYYGFGAEAVYAPLCEGPCNLRLSRGPYHLALARPGGPVLPVQGYQVISGPSTIHAHYVDRSGQRTAGYVVGVVGGIAGIVMIFESFDSHSVCDAYGDCYTHSDVNGALFAGGLGVFIGSAIVSSILIFQHDEASLAITPLRLASLGARRDVPLSALPGSHPQGAAITLSF